MAVCRALVTLHTVDANPANYATNSWWFDDGEAPEVNCPLIVDELVTFYNGLRTYYSPSIATGGHEVQFYRQSDPEPRVPIYQESWTFSAAPSGTALPSEMAVALSFQADKVSGLSQARRRGRVFIGPLNITANSSGRPLAALRAFMQTGATVLVDASADSDWTWVVFSRVNVDASPVTNGWIDDAFDVQRRRGLEWTSRNVWTVSP